MVSFSLIVVAMCQRLLGVTQPMPKQVSKTVEPNFGHGKPEYTDNEDEDKRSEEFDYDEIDDADQYDIEDDDEDDEDFVP